MPNSSGEPPLRNLDRRGHDPCEWFEAAKLESQPTGLNKSADTFFSAACNVQTNSSLGVGRNAHQPLNMVNKDNREDSAEGIAWLRQ